MARPLQFSHLLLFAGFPYLSIRIVPALYHLILLPSQLPEGELKRLARRQVRANRLQTCLVLGDDHCIYMEPDGRQCSSHLPPRGGNVITDRFQSCEAFPESRDFFLRRESSGEFLRTTQRRTGYLLGDLSKGGRPATPEDLFRLAGTRRNGIPKGLRECKVCGQWRGKCLDPIQNGRAMVVPVHCSCQNHNVCARCGEQLYEKRLNGNYYDPVDGKVWHVPGFSGLDHTCRTPTVGL